LQASISSILLPDRLRSDGLPNPQSAYSEYAFRSPPLAARTVVNRWAAQQTWHTSRVVEASYVLQLLLVDVSEIESCIYA
jgi:hypothetical protein